MALGRVTRGLLLSARSILSLRNTRRPQWAVVVVALAILASMTLQLVAANAATCTTRSVSTDRDPIPDCWERRNGLVVGRRDHLTDKDHDGLLAIHEYRLNAIRGGVFGPYRANDANSDDDGGFEKGLWIPPTIDGWEDFDSDGYVNTAERAWRTRMGGSGSHPTLPALGCVIVPAGVPKDGSVNVTLLLQAVVDTVPDGRCLRLRSGGRYRHDGTLRLTWRNDLTIDGNGATLFTNRPGPIDRVSGTSHRSHVVVLGGSNIVIEDLAIVGPNPIPRMNTTYQSEHGFNVKGVTGLTIRDSSVKRVYADFVFVDDTSSPPGSGNIVPTTGLLVTDSNFRTAGRQGFTISASANDVRFEGNRVNGVGRSGVDIEMHPGRSSSGISIVGNTFRNIHLNWIAAGSGSASDVYVGFNRILGDSMHLKIGPRDPTLVDEQWTFEGNFSDTPHRGTAAVYFMQRIRGVSFIGNIQPMNTGGRGRVFEIHEVCGLDLVDNTFTNYEVLYYPTGPPPPC
jgi:hypothetical protein